MYIEFTDEEKKHIQAIKDSYAPQREQLQIDYDLLIRDNKEPEKRHKITIQQQTIIDSMQAEIYAYYETIQQSRFTPIKKSGTEAIISHAKEQIPLILEDTYKSVEQESKNITTKTLKEMKVAVIKKGKLLLNANYAAKVLKEELKLHIDELSQDKTAQQQLLEIIIESAETSPLTDNSEITDAEQKLYKVMRFRRNPLGDVLDFGIFNDKVNARLLQDPDDIFQQTADGQLQLRWAVNQAPQKQEVVPVYLALTYEGDDYKVTKKLTAFDKQVYEAISTRFHYWRQNNPESPLYITPQEVWRTMNGKKSGGSKRNNPSEKQINRICESLDKMRFTKFFMDISNEIFAFNLSIDDERITGGCIETYVLNGSKVVFTTDKGNEVQGYRIGEEPILYTYNKAKKHILFVPYEMLDTSQFTSDTENVAEFKGYLLQQIQLMKNAADEEKRGKRFQRNNTILLETIYTATGIQPPEERIADKTYKSKRSKQKEIRRLRQADRQKIEALLDAWKDKGWINGYTVLNEKNEPIKEKQQAKGYSISI